jgi:hypothetical protein
MIVQSLLMTIRINTFFLSFSPVLHYQVISANKVEDSGKTIQRIDSIMKPIQIALWGFIDFALAVPS